MALHRDAFGTTRMTVEGRLAMMRDPEYRSELDLVAVAPDGSRATSPCAGACRSHPSNIEAARLSAHGRGPYAVSMAAVSKAR